MNLTQVEYFLEAAKCLNFTAAARTLYVSQPALSKQIALLEKELGVPLFHRENRRVELTEAGICLAAETGGVMPIVALWKHSPSLVGDIIQQYAREM